MRVFWILCRCLPLQSPDVAFIGWRNTAYNVLDYLDQKCISKTFKFNLQFTKAHWLNKKIRNLCFYQRWSWWWLLCCYDSVATTTLCFPLPTINAEILKTGQLATKIYFHWHWFSTFWIKKALRRGLGSCSAFQAYKL